MESRGWHGHAAPRSDWRRRGRDRRTLASNDASSTFPGDRCRRSVPSSVVGQRSRSTLTTAGSSAGVSGRLGRVPRSSRSSASTPVVESAGRPGRAHPALGVHVRLRRGSGALPVPPVSRALARIGRGRGDHPLLEMARALVGHLGPAALSGGAGCAGRSASDRCFQQS